MARSPRFTWERRIASAMGPNSPTTRHVLLTIGTHSDVRGCAWPSLRRLAAETALSERAVLEHISIALAEGWLICAKHGSGKGWRLNVYQLAFPADPASAPNARDAADGRSARSDTEDRQRSVSHDGADPGADGADPDAHGAYPDDNIVLTDGQSNNVMINTRNKKNSINGAEPFFPFSQEQTKTSEPPREPAAPQSLRQWADFLGLTRAPGEHEGQFQLRILNARQEHMQKKRAQEEATMSGNDTGRQT